jgi:hypothetical protein
MVLEFLWVFFDFASFIWSPAGFHPKHQQGSWVERPIGRDGPPSGARPGGGRGPSRGPGPGAGFPRGIWTGSAPPLGPGLGPL